MAAKGAVKGATGNRSPFDSERIAAEMVAHAEVLQEQARQTLARATALVEAAKVLREGK